MQVDFTPVNRQVTVTPGSNLLDVLREQQIPISYSCMAGRCQTCRCKVLSGHVEQHLPDEAPEMAAGEVLACCTTLHSACSIELPSVDEIVMHPARTLKTTVTTFSPLCHDVWQLRLKPAKPFTWSAGQFVRLTFPGGGQRSYSMAGHPQDDELEFHIRIVPDGRVTPGLVENLTPGTMIKLNGPMGGSWLRQKHDGPMLCVAGGTGLAPQLSIIRAALAAGMANPIHLYYGCRWSTDLYGVDRLASLAQTYRNFRYHVVLSQETACATHRTGRLPAAVAEDLPTLTGWKVYPAGPPAMVEAMTLQARALGARAEDIHADAFYYQP